MIKLPNDSTYMCLYTALTHGMPREDDIMFQITPEVGVEMIRKDVVMWNDRYKYICILRFVNCMGTVLTEVRCTEVKMYEILDAFEQFFAFGMDSMPIPLEGLNTMNNTYPMIRLERYYTDTPSEADPVIFSVCSYSKDTERITTHFSITMSEDDFLNNFCYMLYFSFLIDIDDGDRGLPPIMN